GHKAFRAISVAYKDDLAGSKLGKAITAQRLHMHEDVRCSLSARQESKSAQPIEPFYPGALEPTRRCDSDMRARRQLRRMNRRRFVHRDDAECLQTLRTLNRLYSDACA